MRRAAVVLAVTFLASLSLTAQRQTIAPVLGEELAVPHHLQDGDLFRTPVGELIDHGRRLFSANWTIADGAGRPMRTGAGKPLADPSQPLDGSRSFNRVSGPDANSCAGCHNRPNGVAGGAGDVVSNVFAAAERFDFVTFERPQARTTPGNAAAATPQVSLATVGNARATPSLFGAGYVEMLARQMTADLQRIRDAIAPGQSKRLVSKGVSFGTLARRADGSWITAGVEGLPAQSLRSATSATPPSLVIRPWHQSGTAVSLREFANTAFNRHHGIQTTERFGRGTDPDRDGVANEMTSADVTAVAFFVATLPVPGRVIPSDPAVGRAIAAGEKLFNDIRCTRCHVPSLPLDRRGWMYSEPGPYNPSGTLRRGDARSIEVDLTDASLPLPRLSPSAREASVIEVPALTDFKLHDITDAADAAAQEALDINQPAGSPAFLAGNRKFLTRRLWGIASQPAHFHDGLLTTLREAVLAHAGEAVAERRAFQRLDPAGQDAVIEFLKSLQMLPPGTRDLVVNEQFRAGK